VPGVAVTRVMKRHGGHLVGTGEVPHTADRIAAAPKTVAWPPLRESCRTSRASLGEVAPLPVWEFTQLTRFDHVPFCPAEDHAVIATDGRVSCCARAASGQAAVPPSSVMNSRLFS